MATHCSSYKNYITAVIALFFFHLVQYYSVTATIDINNNVGFSAHLIRRNSPNLPLFKHKNNARQLMDQNKPGFPLTTNDGAHLFKFSIGTPPTDIYAIADTGSTLTWTQCEPCKPCLKTKYRIFDPRKSSSYRNITCLQKECKLVDDMKSSHVSPDYCTKYATRACPYGTYYEGKAGTEGVLATETVILTSKTGKTVTLKDVIFGCGHLNTVPAGTENENEMGVIGFGRGPLSFVSQIAPYVGGNKFSHCLVPLDTDPKIESKINFGNGSEVTGEGVVSTPLVKFETLPLKHNYVVKAQGITIGKEFVPFSSNATSHDKLQMIVDSGSTVTSLPMKMFEKVAAKLMKALDPKFKPFTKDNSDSSMTYLCLNSTTVPKEPKMTFHFEGGNVQLMTEKMFFKDDEDENKWCFGITHQSSTIQSGIGIYGAIMQANMLIGFDLDREVVSFKPTDCLNY